jgi:hypothetical protein
VNKNHACESCLKRSDGSEWPEFSLSCRFIISHAGSADRYFILESKLVSFLSKSKSNIGYHDEINFELFKKWFQELFLPYFSPKSFIIVGNASCHSVVLEKPPATSSLVDQGKCSTDMYRIVTNGENIEAKC